MKKALLFIGVALACLSWIGIARSQGVPETAVASEKQRACAKCGKTAFSSWWSHCPYCGSKLPSAKDIANDGKPYQINGNVYLNTKHGFRLDRPSKDWVFLPGKLANLLGLGNVLGMAREEAFAVVGVETVKKMKLDEYMDGLKKKMAVAGARSIKEISRDRIAVKKAKGIKVLMTADTPTVSGANINVKIIYAVFDKNGQKIRIAMWADASKFDRYLPEFESIISSFAVLEKK